MALESTYASSINIARHYIKNEDLWVAFGGSSLTWVDNSNPPSPSQAITKFNDLRGLLYVDRKKIVIKDLTGLVTNNTGSYIYADLNLDTETLVDNKAYYLYLEATLPINSQIVGESFRLLGIAEQVELSTTVEKYKGLFIPDSQVVNYDLMLVNTIPTMTIQSSEQKFQFVRRF